jgi:hypothetical protein
VNREQAERCGRTSFDRFEEALHRPAEGLGVEGGVAIELGLDGLEELSEAAGPQGWLARAFERVLEADQAADPGVVAGVGGVGVLGGEAEVEAVLGVVEGPLGDREAGPAEAGSADRDQQRRDRLDTLIEV